MAAINVHQTVNLYSIGQKPFISASSSNQNAHFINFLKLENRSLLRREENNYTAKLNPEFRYI